jgi:predicted O-methyltransferase YrrM
MNRNTPRGPQAVVVGDRCFAATLEISQTATDRMIECVRRANGMLPESVYSELWELSGRIGGGTYLEVGTAHGGATIALALGAKEAGHSVTINTIDRLGGKFSSRSRYGSPEDNRAIIEGNFRFAGVADCISLFVGSTEQFVSQGNCPRNINLLMLDADGMIDRDLAYFYNLLPPGAPIVIDDIDDGIYLGQTVSGTHYIDLKHRLTSLLLSTIVSQKYFSIEKISHTTSFCRKGERFLDLEEFHRLAILCYRELVFSTVSGETWDELFSFFARRSEINQALKIRAAIPPVLVQMARSLYRLRIFGRRS